MASSPLSHRDEMTDDLGVSPTSSHTRASSRVSSLGESQQSRKNKGPAYELVQVNKTEDRLINNETKPWIEDWPAKPRRLREKSAFQTLAICWDIIITLVPVIFLVLGACALDEQPMSELGTNIRIASGFGPTIFPIIFALIVARLMRAISLRCAERGTPLIVLEHLTGSQSLGGTFERTVMLRRFGFAGLAVLSLWLLSPLGGQSSLRILDIKNSTVTSSAPIQYFSTASPPLGESTTVFGGADYMAQSAPVVGALLQASLLEAVNVLKSPVDLWNNVKIPRIEELSPFSDATPGNPWIPINETGSQAWTSLSGLMVRGLPANGSSSMPFEYSYLDLSCGDSTRIWPIKDKQTQNTSYTNSLGMNLTLHPTSFPFTDSGATFFMDLPSLHSPITNSTHTINLVYGSDSMTMGSTSDVGVFLDLFNCSMMLARVEVNVSCNAGSCATVGMRRSENDADSPPIMPFNAQQLGTFLKWLPSSTGNLHDGSVSPLDYYMYGNDSPLEAGLSHDVPDFSKITGQKFSQRLTAILNTAWQASVVPYSLALGGSGSLNSTLGASNYVPAASTTAAIQNQISVYAANRLFIGFLLVITIIMQICAVAGLILNLTATAPDILGYVSSLTRENPYTAVPEGGSTLDGLERARHLGNLRVQLADAAWNEPQGRVVMKSLEKATDGRQGRLSKGKLYA